jgi:single-strand DNA-binding protein
MEYTMYINVVHLVGNLGKNPELKTVRGTDRKYAVLSLATQRSWKGADEQWRSETDWHRVVVWNGLSEYCAAKLRKGDYIYVEGKLVSSTYEKEYGKGKNKITVPHKSWQVKAESIRKLQRAKATTTGAPATPEPQPDETPF